MTPLAFSLALLAAAPDHHEAEPDADGFVSIFDGKSLDGWKTNENANSWSVKDGAIVAKGDRAHLFRTEELTDFVFEGEIKTEPNSNAGIFIHTKFQDAGWPAQGYEIQVNNSFRGDPVRTGSLYNTVKLFDSPVEDGEWYTQRIEVRGNKVIVSIDGEVLYEFDEPPGVTGPRKLGKGVIALQAHDPGSVVHFRNLRVKDLSGE